MSHVKFLYVYYDLIEQLFQHNIDSFFATAVYYLNLRREQPDSDFCNKQFKEICLYLAVKYLLVIEHMIVSQKPISSRVLPMTHFVLFLQHLGVYRKYKDFLSFLRNSLLYLCKTTTIFQNFNISDLINKIDIWTLNDHIEMLDFDLDKYDAKMRAVTGDHQEKEDRNRESKRLHTMIDQILNSQASLGYDDPNSLEEEIQKRI